MAKQKQQYPECEKLSAVRPEMMKITTFVEWLEEQGIKLCSPDDGGGMFSSGYAPVSESVEKILHRYFEIDPKKLEDERRLILERAREANDG